MVSKLVSSFRYFPPLNSFPILGPTKKLVSAETIESEMSLNNPVIYASEETKIPFFPEHKWLCVLPHLWFISAAGTF